MIEIPTLAMTVRQPWAWCTAEGVKHTENRGKRVNHRGWYAIHAGSKWDRHAADDPRIKHAIAGWLTDRQKRRPLDPAEHPGLLHFGMVIGVAYLAEEREVHPYQMGCCQPWGDPWYYGGTGNIRSTAWHLPITRAVKLPVPVPAPGRQSVLWPMSDGVRDRVGEQLEAMAHA